MNKINYTEYLESGNIGFIEKSPYSVKGNPIKIIDVANKSISEKREYSKEPYIKL